MARRGMTIGRHLASLNLFVEDDGKFYITVAGGDTGGLIEHAKRVGVCQGGEWPEEMARTFVALAENLPRKPDGGNNG